MPSTKLSQHITGLLTSHSLNSLIYISNISTSRASYFVTGLFFFFFVMHLIYFLLIPHLQVFLLRHLQAKQI